MPDSQPPPLQPPAPPPLAGQPPGYYAPQQYAVAPTNGAGVTGGVLGIIAVVLSFVPFIDFIAVVLGVLAIIFGAVGVGRANRMGGIGKGMAITGVVCGIVALVISLLFLIAVYGTLIGIHNAATGA
jgi:hypothetical protein